MQHLKDWKKMQNINTKKEKQKRSSLLMKLVLQMFLLN